MEPATLFIVFAVSNGPERTYIGQFGNKIACEGVRERMISQPSPRYIISRSYCWQHGTAAPDWLAENAINGVPLDPKFRP